MSATNPRKRGREEEADSGRRVRPKEEFVGRPLKRKWDDNEDMPHRTRQRLDSDGSDEEELEDVVPGEGEIAEQERGKPKLSYERRRHLQLLERRAAVAEMMSTRDRE
ncbi:hypothetical protein DFH09DRAFT_1326115 [Mycena vulgaris]|nr:hypothetical protein DFH09DRAFT_1326115 [Mycena vulgaris]